MADSKRYEDYGNPTLQQGGWVRTGAGNDYIEYIIINQSPSFTFLSFSPVVFLSRDPIQDTTLHLVVTAPKAPLGCDSFSDSFDELATFQESWARIL